MLFLSGGYGKVSPADIKDSNEFIDALASIRPGLKFDKAAGSYFLNLFDDVPLFYKQLK